MAASTEDFLGVAALAARALGIGSDGIRRIERIKGGLTNESWLVTADVAQVVVRVSTADEAVLHIDRISEHLVLARMQGAGIGPEVLLWEPETRALVTRYIPGTVWSRVDAQEPANIERLAALLKQLHQLPVGGAVAVTDLPATLEHYWRVLATRGLNDPPDTPPRQDLLAIAARFAADPLRSLCHNDVHHLNVIDTGRLWLIDWEYAGIGTPWFDLASVCCNHGYDASLRRQLVAAYVGGSDPASLEQLDDACRLFDGIRSLWHAVRGP